MINKIYINKSFVFNYTLCHVLFMILVFSITCKYAVKSHFIEDDDFDFHERNEDFLENFKHDVHHSGRQCRHAHPKVHDVVTGVHVEEAHKVRKRSPDQPLRIVLFYDNSVYRLEREKFELINNTILPEAVLYWEKTLQVRKTVNSIKLNRKCDYNHVYVKDGRVHCIDQCKAVTMCGDVQVPEEHLEACYVCNATGQACKQQEESPSGPGVSDADFILYVSAIETERCQRGLTVAYAAHCQLESALDRPIAGHANFCPDEIPSGRIEVNTMLSTVQHEMLHALGFSMSLFAFYRDDDGNPYTERHAESGTPPVNEELLIHQWSEKVVKNITRERWMVRGGFMTRNIQVLVTPRVVKEAREHFGCSSIEGVELEDQGGEGTATTHWEKRIMENEAMTGTHTQNPVFSRITLALMEDTGWYRVDYSQAQELLWGKDLGCSFLTRSCKEWINNASVKGKSAYPFCSRVKRDPLQTECSQERDSVALCNLVYHEKPLPPLYQHFDWIPDAEVGTEGNYGGSVSLADYCPYTQEFTWRFNNQVVRGSRCSIPENNPKEDKNFALESYGENSKCFDHTNRMWEQRSCGQIRQWQHWGSGCYEYQCEGGRLHIIVGNYSYECYHAGQEIAIRIVRGSWLHRGALLCPPCKDLCQKQFELRGEWCKPGDEAPPNTAYPRDDLDCQNGMSARAPPLRLHIIAVGISLSALVISAMCLCTGIINKIRYGIKNYRDRTATKLANSNKSKFKLEEVVIKKETQPTVETGASQSKKVEEQSLVPSNSDTSPPPVHEECMQYASGIIEREKIAATTKFEDALRSMLDKTLGIENPNAEPVASTEDLLRKKSNAAKVVEDDDEIMKYDSCASSKNSSFKSRKSRKDSKGSSSRRKMSRQKDIELLDESPRHFHLDKPVLPAGGEQLEVETTIDENLR